ncbi:tetratricopeptide repeat protein [Aquimarina sp. 2201CG5-10]|uniref:tetratricopeptide repeat protein n=1 Tax=Aquimarina callyspongiae TaxID=3098150 RepID=UPI002AB4317C|nr:tetratricopeptide repeat protein [Aquimarina sp. 2201CG5-10]MDY8138024.1 tetratricopeptide repeat protein [Aquimarina sp. 2201CG5-10]
MEQQLEETTSDSLKVKILLSLGRYHFKRDFNRIEEFTSKAQEIIGASNYNSAFHQAKISVQNGVFNARQSNYGKALKHYYEAKTFFEKQNDSFQLAPLYFHIANLYRFQKNYQDALTNFKKAITINNRLGLDRNIAINYRFTSILFSEMKQKDSALFYLGKAQKKYEAMNHKPGLFEVLSIKSGILISEEKYDEALAIEKKNLVFFKEDNKWILTMTTHTNIAKAYVGLGDFNKAITHINETISLSKKHRLLQPRIEAYEIRSMIYHKKGNHKKSLEDYKEYKDLSDKEYNISKSNEIKELELSYKFANEKAKDSLLFKEEQKRLIAINENEAFKNKLYIIIVILISLLSFIGIRALIKELKKVKTKSIKTEGLLEVKRKEVDNLAQDVITKKEAISDLMKESLRQIKVKERLLDDLNKLDPNSNSGNKLNLNDIISYLKSDVVDDSRVHLIKEHLEAMNYELFQKLKDKHPNLTKVDLEICSYLRLSLGRKEIAKLRFTSVDAVKKTRSRLRKKMHLSMGVNLEEYIKSI